MHESKLAFKISGFFYFSFFYFVQEIWVDFHCLKTIQDQTCSSLGSWKTGQMTDGNILRAIHKTIYTSCI
jgi:hypothetical protein